MAAAKKKFMLDDPEDEYWNQSSTSGFNFDDSQPTNSKSVSGSQPLGFK